jgi:hypothetical protein
MVMLNSTAVTEPLPKGAALRHRNSPLKNPEEPDASTALAHATPVTEEALLQGLASVACWHQCAL